MIKDFFERHSSVVICSIICIVSFIVAFLGVFITTHFFKNKNSYATDITNPNQIEDIQNAENTNLDNLTKHLPLHDFAYLKLALFPRPNPDAKSIIKNIYFSEEKQVYLTFDDGPTKVTNQILDVLKEYNVKATFFVLGKRVDQNPDILRRIFSEGHYIANHSYSHDYSSLYSSVDSVVEEFKKTENSIKKALNNPDFNTYLFRFPGGSSGGYYSKVKTDARAKLDEMQIAYTNWNCLTRDAENAKTSKQMMDAFLESKEDYQSLILLMHDASDKKATAEFLPELLDYLKNEGYTFKTFYEVFK